MKHQFLCLRNSKNSRWLPLCFPNTKNDQLHIFTNRNDFVNKGTFFLVIKHITHVYLILNVKSICMYKKLKESKMAAIITVKY